MTYGLKLALKLILDLNHKESTKKIEMHCVKPYFIGCKFYEWEYLHQPQQRVPFLNLSKIDRPLFMPPIMSCNDFIIVFLA